LAASAFVAATVLQQQEMFSQIGIISHSSSSSITEAVYILFKMSASVVLVVPVLQPQ
jgi:hypothetical protein